MLDGALSSLGRDAEVDSPEADADADADGVFPALLPPVNALSTLFLLVRFASSWA